jgi:hypothetical protein
MKQEIKYKGYTTSPSDYECLDGDMAAMTNLIPEGGTLRPIAEPEVVQHFGARRPTRIWVRETPLFTHYIYPFGGNLYYREKDKDEADKVMCEIGFVDIFNLEIMGNTIIVITSEGLHYILWKADEDGNFGYVDLGNSIPECPISFGLQGDKIKRRVSINEEPQPSSTQAYLAAVNSFIADMSINAGKFIFPFLVRYAYRLYDGVTLTHHSAPILMMPSTYEAPVVWIDDDDGDKRIHAVCADLDYQLLLPTNEYEDLKKWKDIIKSVDIFISAPIYSYDQNGEVGSGYIEGDPDCVFVGKYRDDQIYGFTKFVSDSMTRRINIPMRDRSNIEEDVRSCSNFYFLKSIPIEELSDERKIIHIEPDYLPSLTTREVMTDDYQSHDTLIAKYSQVYNGRLNISNIMRRPFKGYDLASMVCYRNEGTASKATSQVIMPVDDGRAVLERESSIALTEDANTYSYLYYPDSSALALNVTDHYQYMTGYHLTPHAFLNGAVRFFSFPIIGFEGGDSVIYGNHQITNPTIKVPNKIYTSQVNNPFFFPVTGINTIGTGEIYGIRSAAKALSEGQMGQFPLYAFTSEGVWALSVNAQGGYNAIQPIIEDVCLSPESIVQMDSSVAFASQRGIMILEGSNAICISDEINTEHPFNLESLPHLPYAPAQVLPFYVFLDNCKLLWDYFNQRLIVGSTTPYSYVYSLESKSWGIINKGNYMAVPSYPNTLALDPDTGILYDFSTHADLGNDVYVISRPIKCDGADYLKQITSVIQRGVFSKGSIQTILYGSRDMLSWHLVASSTDHILRGFRGTPYKYFRVVFMGTLKGGESITGCTIDFNVKYANKTR